MFFFILDLKGNDVDIFKNDSLRNTSFSKDPALFYDSLEVKANRYRVTKWIYDWMICSENTAENKVVKINDNYRSFHNKTIGSISIKSLDVFGPDFNDTAKTTNLWVEKMANKFHSKSNLNVIRKNLWIKEGQALDTNIVMDNERLLRSLPYLKDVRFIVTPRIENNELVDVLILTKDVFSLGVSGAIGNVNRGDLAIFDNNIFGIGHEIGVKLVGNTQKTPHLGYETYYAINNFKGNFINISAGYSNTFLRRNIFLSIERDFLRPQSVYAGGLTAYRSFRSDNVYATSNVSSTLPLDYLMLDMWYGRRLKLAINADDSRFRINLSGRIRYISFNDRPLPDADNHQFFANSTQYFTSLSFSRRSYIKDRLIYSYGITEDIPQGYLHEFVVGFDRNEYGNRWYSHFFFSTGNLLKKKSVYLYNSLGVGGYFNKNGIEQGIVDMKASFISPLFTFMGVQSRQFLRLNYTVGINRFELENLLLRYNEGIRGFGSLIEKGKQRLTLNVENVFFQKKRILNFQSAFFTFLDIGLVGPAKQSIFHQTYYSGIGVGLRIRNENLIFKTIQLRLAYYPNSPKDVSSVGFIFEEVSKSRFNSFQPRGPEPLRFE